MLPNESNPCERHFQFESLAEPKHSSRVRALDIDFDGISKSSAEGAEIVRLALGSCRFFTLSFPHLTTLSWKDEDTMDASHLFSTSPFTPALRSLAYVGPWDGLIEGVNNLTSFELEGDGSDRVHIEDLRSFLLNNSSLELLGLEYVSLAGDSIGPPACLSNLKSLSVSLADSRLSTIIRVPALQHLSSLRIGLDDEECHTLHATGDGIAFSARCFPGDIARTLEEFTGYARPVIRHVHLDDSGAIDCEYNNLTLVSVLLDAHTLEIGLNYLPDWYDGFLDDLKRLGPQLKTIRFAIPEELEPFAGDPEFWGDGNLLDTIEDLVRYRCHQGRPLSAVERMVTSNSERVNREQDFV